MSNTGSSTEPLVINILWIVYTIKHIFIPGISTVFQVVLFLQVSRAQILKKAAEYIQFIRRKNQSHQSDIDDLKKQNSTLEQQSMFKVKSQDL